MDIRELQLMLHLSKSLQFTKTSHDCHVSPSSLTRIIQKLEQELGVNLFERDNRTVHLTPAGLKFREYAVETIERWQQLQRDLRDQSDTLQGTLSVFCSVTASYSFLHDLLNQFRLRYPAVEMHLHTGDSALAVQRILNEENDIGVAAKPDRLPEKLEFKEIGQSPLVFIAPAVACPLTELIAQSAGGIDLPWEDMPFISTETGLLRTRVDRWFRSKGLQPDIYAQVSGNEAIVSMVSLGFGVAVVPLLVVENSPIASKIEILKVEPELEPFTIGLCALKRKLANPLVKAFWDLAPMPESA
jgi:LysR family transcriptional regulator, positive regulator for ilvC